MTERWPPTVAEGVVICYLLVVVGLIILPNVEDLSPRREAIEQAERCRANLREIAEGLQRFSLVHSGALPADLNDLAPKYVVRLPLCPSTEGDPGSDRSYAYEVSPDGLDYTVSCRGSHHHRSGLPPGLPRYSLKGGLESP